MKLDALAELILDWKGIEFSLPNREKARDEALAIRSTIIDDYSDKGRSIPSDLYQTIQVDLELINNVLQSKPLPDRLLKSGNTALWTPLVGGDKRKIDFTSELNAHLSIHKRKTSSQPRGYIKNNILCITKAQFPYILLDAVFQNPLDALAFEGKSTEDWDIEESLVGRIKAFLVPNRAQPTDGGEIRVTQGNDQNNV